MHDASVALDKGKIDVAEFLRRVSAVCGFPPAQIQAEFDSHNKFDQDVIALIDDLVQNYQVGLISNGPSAFVHGLLKKGGIENTFHHIVISSEVGMVKPQPEIFEHMLAKMRIDPAASIFIDDNPKNVTAAQALGIHGIVYTDLPGLQSELRHRGVMV